MRGMRALRLVLAVVIGVLVLRAVPAYSSHGGVMIPTLAIDPLTPTTLYAGTLGIYWGSGELTLGGVYKSTNRGASWSPVMLFDPGPLWYGSYCSPCGGVLALAIDPLIPTTLYGGTEAINVYDEWGESFRQWPQSGKVQLSSLA